ncbi:helix-turn-helix domain-containing protein [Paenibacillus cellulositrophicus]|uniref:helix-turn-helix domain-containing protein n=1 Tax=Paenibacillus cellulositrophicus TaxID=562959 RepID=UPI003F7E63F3
MNNKISIREAREKKGMSLIDVCEETGMSVKKMEWYEANPGEFEFDQAVMLCKLYGVNFNDVHFNLTNNDDYWNDIERRDAYPAAKRLHRFAEIKTKLTGIILSIVDDAHYSDRHIINEILDVISEIEEEESIFTREILEKIDRKKGENHHNLSLAGR